MPVAVAPPGLRIAYYGDDFTGSTDTLATLTNAGLSAMLFLGVPTAEIVLLSLESSIQS